MKKLQKNQIGRDVPEHIQQMGDVKPYIRSGKRKEKYITESDKVYTGKVVGSLKEAIVKAGLQDGMTISFHHHLRAGDMVLPKVMEAIDELGIKDLTICASSLTSSHECLIDYIKRGVVTSLQTSGMRGELGKQVSKGLLDTAVVFRTHGGRARAIQKGDVTIDVAFIAASCCDDMGNMNGQQGPSAFGSMGYAMVDARYAKKVVAVTDNLVDFPAYPVSIPQTLVDIVAEIDQIGDPELMGQGATRKTKSPLELTIAEYASKVLIASGLIKNGFSYQAGTGGVSLAVVRFLRDYMKENHIIGSFGSGGITSTMVELLNEGLFTGLLDVQTFDKGAVESIRNNGNHIEMDAGTYADPLTKGCVTNNLDIMILSATEVDVNFNVNVLTASNGYVMGALGGHPDTAAGAKLAIVVCPLTRKRIPIVVDEVMTICTPGPSVDVVVTERGIAVNPNNPLLKAELVKAGLPVVDIKELRDMAYSITGKPNPPKFGENIVGVVEYRDGTVIDMIKNVID